MPRTSTAVPEDLNLLIKGAVESGVFSSKSSAIESMLEAQFREDEGLRCASACGLFTLSQDSESNVGVSKTELIQMANLTNEDLQRALAKELGVDSSTADTATDHESVLNEIKKSVPSNLDEEN